MPRLILLYLILFAVLFLVFNYWRKKREGSVSENVAPVPKRRARKEKFEWIQVYDTDSLEDAKRLIARLEEEEIECLFYEQGRKDVHGNALKGFGIIVPRTSVSRAQSIISRMPV